MSANGNPRFYEIRDAILENATRAFERIRADRALLDARSGLGETLMHWFAVEYREDIVRALLALGAAVDPRNHFGSTPFAEASQLENQSMCRLLLEHGAQVDTIDQNGETPLMNAAFLGKAEMCRFLLDSGASPAFALADFGSVLGAAIDGGRIEIVEMILDRLGPDFDVASLPDSEVFRHRSLCQR